MPLNVLSKYSTLRFFSQFLCLQFLSIIISVLLLWGDTTTEAAYKRKHLIGGFLMDLVGESLTITDRIKTASRQLWCWISRYKLISRGRERERVLLAWALKTSELTLSGIPPRKRPHILLPPKTFSQLVTKHSNI